VLKGATGAPPAFGAIVDADIDNAAAIAVGKINGTALVNADFNSLRSYLADGMLLDGTLTISATAEKFKTTTTAVYTIAGVTYTKAATDDLVFSAADTINVGGATNTFYGAWLIEINAAGTVATKPAGGLSDQVYESSAAAIAALPSVTASSVSLGYVVVTLAATAGETWTANTSALTAIHAFSDTQIKALPAAK
jgi:hypothetical protein